MLFVGFCSLFLRPLVTDLLDEKLLLLGLWRVDIGFFVSYITFIYCINVLLTNGNCRIACFIL